MRWVAVGLVVINVLLMQVVRGQATRLAEIRTDLEQYRTTIAELEAENEAARIELAVINVLDSNDLEIDPARRRGVARTILRVAESYDLPPELILGVIFTESRFDIRAQSHMGAVGLMQLMPATATQLARELEIDWKGQELLSEPEVNILLGGFYLRKLIERFEDLDVALAAYNAGPNRVHSLLSARGRAPRLYPRQVQRATASLRERYF
ncbi:MAG: lytic transglycosylase domain-containing protein [Acidobacteriota bacterium]